HHAAQIFYQLSVYAYSSIRLQPASPTRRSSDLLDFSREGRRICKKLLWQLLTANRWGVTERFAAWRRRADRTNSRAALGACSARDRKSTRLNSSHGSISYAVFVLKKKHNLDEIV